MDGDDIIFYGNSGQECEEFVRAVRKAGFQAQKIRDDAWMADFASTCLTGRALRYYETLSPEAQGDWRLLRQALLKEYPLEEPDNSTVQTGDTGNLQAPTPAAAAPAPLQNKRGRIKIKGADGSDFGYLGFGRAATGASIGAGFTQNKALSISYAPASQPFEIDIEQPSGKRQVLGTFWNSTPVSTAVGPQNYAVVTAIDCDGSKRSSGVTWNGPLHTEVWSVAADNTLVAYWKYDTVHSSLSYMVYTAGPSEARAIDVVAEVNTICTATSAWKSANLFIEPLT